MKYIRKLLQHNILALIAFYSFCFGACAGEKYLEMEYPQTESLAELVNPFDSACYDWKDDNIPCQFKRPYAELLLDEPIPADRFVDNKDGTVTDRLTMLIWLKNLNCFGMLDWRSAAAAANNLKDGDCGPSPSLALADGSSAGDWRSPTMNELCTLIDFSRRDPALPKGHLFLNVPRGFHWSATTLAHHPEMAWILYIESGTTCYDSINSRAGHVWPVRGPVK